MNDISGILAELGFSPVGDDTNSGGPSFADADLRQLLAEETDQLRQVLADLQSGAATRDDAKQRIRELAARRKET